MKNRSILEKLGDFVLGKGFYIVLFLCVATIGISGYYLVHSLTSQPQEMEPAGGGASVVLPDSEANGPDPAPGGLTGGGLTDGQDSLSSRQEQEQPDDPEPVKQPQEEPEEDSQTGTSEQSAALVFTWPVKGEVLRDFSAETLALDPTLEDWRTHMGVDIAASLGVEVLAIASGTVSAVYEDGLMGTTVVVDHGNGLVTTYSNLAGQPTVESGDTVETGTILGTVGSTAIAESGLSSHLHLEASLNGVPVDPMEYLPQ